MNHLQQRPDGNCVHECEDNDDCDSDHFCSNYKCTPVCKICDRAGADCIGYNAKPHYPVCQCPKVISSFFFLIFLCKLFFWLHRITVVILTNVVNQNVILTKNVLSVNRFVKMDDVLILVLIHVVIMLIVMFTIGKSLAYVPQTQKAIQCFVVILNKKETHVLQVHVVTKLCVKLVQHAKVFVLFVHARKDLKVIQIDNVLR